MLNHLCFVSLATPLRHASRSTKKPKLASIAGVAAKAGLNPSKGKSKSADAQVAMSPIVAPCVKVEQSTQISALFPVLSEDDMLVRPSPLSIAEIPSKRALFVEYARSGTSCCSSCGNTIRQGNMRMGVSLPSQTGDFMFVQWHHLDCFDTVFCRSFGGIEKVCGVDSACSISGLCKLTPSDRRYVCQSLLKSTPFDNESHEGLFDAQNVALSKATDILGNLSNSEWKSFQTLFFSRSGSSYSNAAVVSGKALPKAEAMSLIADAIVFGDLPVCPLCTSASGCLRPFETSYKCSGNIDAYTRCPFEARVLPAPRVAIPSGSALFDKLPALKQCVLPAGCTRILFKDPKPVESSRADLKALAIDQLNPNTIFSGIRFLEPFPSEELRKIVQYCGGVVECAPSDTSTILQAGKRPPLQFVEALCSNNALQHEKTVQGGAEIVTPKWLQVCREWRTMPHPIELPRQGEAVSPDFIPINAPQLGPADKLKQWDEKRSQADKKKIEERASAKIDSSDKVSGNKKVTFLGGIPVDAECAARLTRPGQVVLCTTTGHPFSVSLASADVARNMNKFYILQLVKDPVSCELYLFRRWGRVGDDVKKDILVKKISSLEQGIREFKAVFFDKTGNAWMPESSTMLSFTKQPEFMDLVLISSALPQEKHTEGNEQKGSSPTGVSVLDPITRSLMDVLFDQTTLVQSMQQMSIDTEKLPVGSLRQETLNRGKALLNNAQLILNESTNLDRRKLKLTSATNQFYSCVPHAFSEEADADSLLLDSSEKIAEKYKLLDDLADIIVAQEIQTLSQGAVDSAVAQYQSLNVVLEPLSPTSREYRQVSAYLVHTHASTHKPCELQAVWKLQRQGEDRTFNPLNLPNKKLLWHGSRLTNWIRILQQGLKIAPPDAPSTGYMFGKGVYFADMFTKSANYCHFGTRNVATGLLALAEVALGTPTVRHYSDFITTLPKGTHSCFAMGSSEPDPAMTEPWIQDGEVSVPCGKPVRAGSSGSLLYNEFIVYDTAQIRLRYLLQVKPK